MKLECSNLSTTLLRPSSGPIESEQRRSKNVAERFSLLCCTQRGRFRLIYLTINFKLFCPILIITVDPVLRVVSNTASPL